MRNLTILIAGTIIARSGTGQLKAVVDFHDMFHIFTVGVENNTVNSITNAITKEAKRTIALAILVVLDLIAFRVQSGSGLGWASWEE